MALVGPRVNRDSLGPEGFAVKGGFGYIRHVTAAGIPDGGYLIYVDTESGHGFILILSVTKIRKIIRNVLILAFDLIRRYTDQYENRIFYPAGRAQK
jgi:hypothetical protein